MKHSKPTVTIDLAEYLELKGKVSDNTEQADREQADTSKMLVLHQMFIGRLYDSLSVTEKLKHHRLFESTAKGLNAEIVFKPLKFEKQDIEIKPLG